MRIETIRPAYTGCRRCYETKYPAQPKLHPATPTRIAVATMMTTRYQWGDPLISATLHPFYQGWANGQLEAQRLLPSSHPATTPNTATEGTQANQT